jgi:hypothetical protein
MISAWPERPLFRICSMHAFLFERKINANIFEIKLLNLPQSLTSANSAQSAHVAYLLSIQQVRSLHHEAFMLSRHPGHLSFKYLMHAPQYNPQYATRLSFFSMFFMISPDVNKCTNYKIDSLYALHKVTGLFLLCFQYTLCL